MRLLHYDPLAQVGGAQTAVLREVQEEGNAEIYTPVLFGYKKITAQNRVLKPRPDAGYYPFPFSFVPFFYAYLRNFSDKHNSDDVIENKVVSLAEAISILQENAQYIGIIDYVAFSHRLF